MPDDAQNSLAQTALNQIAEAFAARKPPKVMTESKQLADFEYDEVMSFEGLRWQDVTYEMIKVNDDAISFFAPEAFCYYLPGFLTAEIKAGNTDSLACDGLLHNLDRSPEPDYWDDHFLPRWTLLSAAEIDAVAAWLRWYESVEPDVVYDNTYERAHATLALLKARAAN